MMERNDVFREIDDERDYQDSKWGTLEQNPHTVAEWLLILRGELNEAMDAWQKRPGDMAALDEIRQVAACAVACMEEHGAPSRGEGVNMTTTTPGALAPLWTLAMVQAWLDEHATDDIKYAVILASDIVYDYEAERHLDKARIVELETQVRELERMVSLYHLQALQEGEARADEQPI